MFKGLKKFFRKSYDPIITFVIVDNDFKHLKKSLRKNIKFHNISSIKKLNYSVRKSLVNSDIVFIIPDSKNQFLNSEVSRLSKTRNGLALGLINESEREKFEWLNFFSSVTYFENDKSILNMVNTLCDISNNLGVINIDLNDIKNIISNSGTFFVESITVKGPESLIKATNEITGLLKSKCDKPIDGCIFNVTGDNKLSLIDFAESSDLIRKISNQNENIIMGYSLDKNLEDFSKISIIAGYDTNPQKYFCLN